jgi:hypothetical protein
MSGVSFDDYFDLNPFASCGRVSNRDVGSTQFFGAELHCP